MRPSIGQRLFGILSSDPPLTAIVGTQIYPMRAPQTVRPPFVVYTVVDEAPVNSLGGHTSGRTQAVVQFDAWSGTDVQAWQIAEAIGDVFARRLDLWMSSTVNRRWAGFDDEADLHRVSTTVVLSAQEQEN